MKRIICLAVIVCLCMAITGCDLWMQGKYTHVTPYQSADKSPQTEKINVSSYQQLLDALTELVESATLNATILYPKENLKTVQEHMESAVRSVQQHNPIAGYGVESIDFEVGTKGGIHAVAVNISYLRSTSEIRSMKILETMEDASEMIYEALNKCEPSVTFYIKQYAQVDLVQLVKDYVDAKPDVCMELPQATVTSYPQEGDQRVIEVLFDYHNSREDLRSMQSTVADIFEAAHNSVKDEEDAAQKYEQLYRFIMLNYDADAIRTSITPAYSLLHHGVGDSKAYATVYAAMCTRAGLACEVITGTKDSQVYYWNAIWQGVSYVFVDLLQCATWDRFTLLTQNEMGNYVWDYSAYPG